MHEKATASAALLRVYVTFASGVLILIGAGVLTALALANHGDDNDWVSHSEKVRLVVAELDSDVHALAFGTYARLLLPDQAHGYDSTAMVRSFRTLRALTADNPQQQRRVDELDVLLEAVLVDFRAANGARLGPNAARLAQSIAADLATIDAALARFQSEEALLLRARVRRAAYSRTSTLVLLLFSIGVALVLTVSAWARLRVCFRRERQLHAAVVEREQRLRALLDNTSDSVWWVDRGSSCAASTAPSTPST